MANARRMAGAAAVVAALVAWAWWLASRDDAPPSGATADARATAAEHQMPTPHAPRRHDEKASEKPSADAPAPPETKPPDATAKEGAEKFPLAVTVLRADGTAAACAQVLFIDPNDDGNPSFSATADAGGVATLRAQAGLARVVAWLGSEAAADPKLVDPSETHAATIRLESAVVVHGKVTLGGRPAAGASVVLTMGPWLGSEFGLVLVEKSDAEGRFAFPPVAARGLDGTEGRTIDATTRDLAAGQAAFDADAARRGEDVVVEMLAPVTVRGRLLDTTRRPVWDATVRHCVRADVTAVTDDDGRFEVRLPGGVGPKLVALPPSYWDIDVQLANPPLVPEYPRMAILLPEPRGEAPDLDLGDVIVHAGKPVNGIVVDGSGAPAVHARVDLYLDGVVAAAVRTDADGRFVVPEVGPDAHWIGVRENLPKGSPATPRTAIVNGVHGGDPDLRIVLEDSFAIRFRFLSAEDRKPLACAQFDIRAKHHGEGFDWFPWQNAGDAVETFDFGTISAGTFDVEVDVAGYEPLRFESVEVTAAAPTVLDLLLRKRHE
jgi:hypothetical protein